MSLSPMTPRCQGRFVGFMGSATIAADCVKCQRRTDPPTMPNTPWMQPPPLSAWTQKCPSLIEPEEPAATNNYGFYASIAKGVP